MKAKKPIHLKIGHVKYNILEGQEIPQAVIDFMDSKKPVKPKVNVNKEFTK